MGRISDVCQRRLELVDRENGGYYVNSYSMFVITGCYEDMYLDEAAGGIMFVAIAKTDLGRR